MREKSTCSIRGCESTTYARTWCRLHYGRWRRLGDPEHPVKTLKRHAPKPCAYCATPYVSYNPDTKYCSLTCKNAAARVPLDIELIREFYEAGFTQTEIAEKLATTQKVIWAVMQREGIDARVAAKRDQRGENNAYWRGGRLTYNKRARYSYKGNRLGYVKVKAEGHPHANKLGYVYEHYLVALDAAGRERLDDDEVVHHINCDSMDNRPENLVILKDDVHRAYHAGLEQVIGQLVDMGIVAFDAERGYYPVDAEGGDAQ